MSALDDLRSAGFSDAEVGDYATQQRATLSSAGFSDAEINQHLGPTPDTAGANKSFARVIGDALTKSAAALKPAGDTMADIGQVYPAVEAALNAGTGLLFGFPAYVGAGLGGLVSKHLLGTDADPKELAETMSKVVTYQPFTERGRRLTGNVMLPLTLLQEGSEAAGHFVTNVATKTGAGTNTAAVAGAITDASLQMLPAILLGELNHKMGGQTVTADDMHNTAKVIAGNDATPEAVQATQDSLHKTYEQTGIGPYTVLKEAEANPEMRAEMADPEVGVPKAFDQYVEKPAVPDEPVPGDGAPVLDLNGPTEHESAEAIDSGIATEPTSAKEIQQGKQAAKRTIRAMLAEDEISPDHAFRGTSIDELQEIARTGELVIGRNAEGEPATSAATVGKGDFAAYGNGSGYIAAPEMVSKSGLAGEVHVDPMSDAKQLTYLVNGKAMDFAAMKEAVLGKDGAPKSKADAELDNWLKQYIGEKGVVEMNAGLNPAASLRAIRDSYTPFVGVESPHAPVKPVADAIEKGAHPILDSLQKIFAPASRGDVAATQAGIMRANFGEMARERELALNNMKDYAAEFDKLPAEDNIKFIDSMERGTTLSDPHQAEAAKALRGLLDEKRDEVQALGKGQLENFDDNYFPHMWKDQGAAETLFSRRPLEGSKGFLKARTIPFTTDGLRWRAYNAEGDFIKSFDSEAQAKLAAGTDGRVGKPLTPITTNPVEMALLKAREMDKYIYGQRIFGEMKDADLARFVQFGDHAPAGWTKIDDKIARVWDSPDQTISEGYDQRLMEKLNKFAAAIGVSPERRVKIGGTRLGYASRTGETVTKFGGPETVLTHELGHQLDFKYGLKDEFVNDPATKKELRALADLRYEGTPADQVPESFKRYVRKSEEKMANMVHAYVHMPERFKEVAPNTYAKFTEFIDSHPELSSINDIKPSLVLGTNTATSSGGPGMILRGEFYAPDQAATLINNHLSPGLQGNGFYDAWRGIGNAINGLQLGLSAFHVGFTSMDAMISKASLGVKQISRGDVLEGAGNIAQGLNPAQPFVNIYKGDKLLRAYLGELNNPDLMPIVDAIQQAGGRVKMDDFYRNATVNAFKQALRRASLARAADDFGAFTTASREAASALLPTVLDRISAPIFEYLVPRQKLGVFFDMAQDWIKQNPEATVAEKRAGMGKLWDSVDNRMGQLVYDNVFWDRALKDGLMATVRSVGWNLGTFRELGGGVLDIKDIGKQKGFSDRTAYVVALPLIASIYGAILNYAYTGEAPQSLKDAFYPKTGRLRPDGSEDRVSLPTYMKDVFAYGEDMKNFVAYGGDPTQTIKNKLHPLIATVTEMLNNKDFFGGAIRNPADKAIEQLADEAAFIIQQFSPFSYRNYLQQAKAKGEEPSVIGYLTSPSMIGITPAPGYIAKSPEELESGQVSQLHDSLVTKFKEEIKGGKDVEKLIPQMIKSGMTKRDIKYIISSSGDVPKPHKLKSFGKDDE